MASSSSSRGKYDVFLSFRGEDTRDNFTSHLYAALCRKKIKTFIDDGLSRGDDISESLFSTIERSKISVIIFSTNYASSKWCLNELSKIVECRKKNGLKIIPVFYRVKPSDVRKQTGSFGDAFAGYEKISKGLQEMVKNWKAALIEASNVSGWDSMVTRPEAKLIDEIVKDILKNLNYISSSSDFEGLVGLSSRVERIKSLLCIKSPDFRIVGIWGMGGIGKTTIAGAIFERICRKFEGKCFMANVRQELEKGGGLIHLREQFLSQLLEENLKIETPNIPQYIKERLQEMKVCIVLDDVNKFSQLEYLAGGLNQFGSGSRIIITTRDKQVLDKFGVDCIYEVKGLNHDEALELFCNYAFRKNHCPQDLMMLSKMVVKYAEGNPLALKVLGSSLYRKTKQDWDNALNNLKQISGPDIYDVLKISYSELNWEEKNIFLDIACFFKGEDRNHVTTILSDSYLVHYGLNILIDKSLITVSGNKLQMHDLLQEMGQEIVRQESYKEPGKRSRLWHYEDVCHVLKKNKGTDSIEGIFLDMSKIRDINLSSKAFMNMSNIRLLKFYVPEFSDISNRVSKVHLPQGLEYLTDELRYFHWHGYPLKTLPSNFSPENLIVLSLPYSEVEKLWMGEKEAFKLKLIDLHHSRNFLRIPGPLETPNLERINLWSCTNLQCIPSSIQNFSKLSILDLQGCKSFRRFPNDIHFGSSIILDFSNCVNLTEFPQISGNVKELHLCGTAIEEVPSSIECLTELVALNMGYCTKLKSLPTSICKLKSLHWVNLDNCWGLESFPEISEKMECLEYISLALTTIDVLPSSSDHIEGQRILGLSNGFMLDNLSKNQFNVRCRGLALPPLPGLSSLTRLNLSYRKIINIPPDIGCLFKLRSLDLRGNNFESLPTSIKQLSLLKYLMLSHCHMLQSLPELPVLSLNYLEVMNCRQLQFMPELSSCLDELDASELEAVSKRCIGFSRTGIGNIVRFMFTNCLKLSKKACNNILADSLLRIQNMATASLRLFYERKLSAPPGISICLPGNRIPNCFSYQSSKSSITIQLPRHWCNIRFKGFAICVVVEVVEGFKAPTNFGVECRYYFGSESFSETKYSCWLGFLMGGFCRNAEELRIDSDHLLLGFDPYLDVRLPNGGHHTVASFKFFLYPQNYNCTVKCCGVCPLYANPSETESES